MGYNTEFSGSIAIDPPLSPKEVEFINMFCASRRMARALGPYHCGSGYAGQGRDPDIEDFNRPPEGQPSLWCKWIASEDGRSLSWDGRENFYGAREWMAYLRTHFIVGLAAKVLALAAMDFLRPHAMSGEIRAVGEYAENVWRMKVDSEGVWFGGGRWSAQGEADMYSGDAWDFDVPRISAQELVQLAWAPGRAHWDDIWERVPDHGQPCLDGVLAAARELLALEASAGQGPSGARQSL